MVDITSTEPTIEVRLNDGSTTKVSPDLLAKMSPESQINQIVDPEVRNFFLNDNSS